MKSFWALVFPEIHLNRNMTVKEKKAWKYFILWSVTLDGLSFFFPLFNQLFNSLCKNFCDILGLLQNMILEHLKVQEDENFDLGGEGWERTGKNTWNSNKSS